MVGTAFYRSHRDKCPQCGSFGDDTDRSSLDDTLECPVCDTVFNEYIVLNRGDDQRMRNN